MKQAETQYRAFISYRHADNTEQGRQWATWLHQAIETYEVPEDLVGTLNQRGEAIPARIYPVFRDEQELPAHADLGAAIIHALDASQFLVVLCSPRAAQSTYVADEIAYFKEHGRSDAIMAAIIDGEPNAGRDQGKQQSGWTERDECFPEPLLYEYDDGGQRTNRHAEPIAADFRVVEEGSMVQGWTSSEAYRSHLQRRSSLEKPEIQRRVAQYAEQRNLMVLKIVAGILGLPLRVLTQRDKAYQLAQEKHRSRRLKIWLSLVVLLAVSAVIAGGVAYTQSQRARQQRDEALTTQSRFLMDLARQANDQGFYDTAMLLGLHALPGVYGGERPAVTDQHELRRAVAKSRKRIQITHAGAVNCVAYSSDGRQVASAGEDGNVILWSAATGEKSLVLTHDKGIVALAFSPDDRLLAVACGGRIYVHDLAHAGQEIALADEAGYFTSVAFSCDGRLLLSRSLSKAVVWSLAEGHVAWRLQHGDYVHDCCFSPDGRLVATASYDATAALWSMTDGRRLQRLSHLASVNSVRFSADGTRLVTSSHDRTAAIWSVTSGALLHQFRHDSPVTWAQLAADQDTLITATPEQLSFWSLAAQRRVAQQAVSLGYGAQLRLSPHGDYIGFCATSDSGLTLLSIPTAATTVFRQTEPLCDFAFAADETTVVTASKDGTAALWSVSGDESRFVWKHERPVTAVDVSPDGRNVVSLGEEPSLRVWSLESGAAQAEIVLPDVPVAMTLTRDGSRVLTVTADGTLAVWSTENGRLLYSFIFETAAQFACFTPDASRVAVVSVDETVRVWSVDQGKLLGRFAAGAEITSVSYDETGERLLVTTKDRRTVVLDPESLQPRQVLASSTAVVGAAFVPGLPQVVTLSASGESILWSLADETAQPVFTHPVPVEKMLVSPDHARLVTIGSDQSVAVWSLAEERLVQQFSCSRAVDDVAFSPDGQLLAIAQCTVVEIYDVLTGELLYALSGDAYISGIGFTVDSQCLVTGSRDASVVVWPLWRDDLEKTAISKLPVHRRQLTPAERRRYFLSPLPAQTCF